MKIDHISLYVLDLENTKKFYEKYFMASSGDIYHNKRTGLKTYFLNFESGVKLEIMFRGDLLIRKRELKETGYIHLAISVGSREKVDSLTQILERDGYSIISYPRVTGDGYYESVVLDNEYNQIEIVE